MRIHNNSMFLRLTARPVRSPLSWTAKRTGWQIFASCNFPPEDDRIRPVVEKAILQEILAEQATGKVTDDLAAMSS